MKKIIASLEAEIQKCESAAALFATEPIKQQIKKLADAADELAAAWSKSPIGYHSLVYYRNLAPAPPSDPFDSEWGLEGSRFNPPSGNWHEQDYAKVVDELLRRAGNPDLDRLEATAKSIAQSFEQSQNEVTATLAALLTVEEDRTLEKFRSSISAMTSHLTKESVLQAEFGGRQLMSRDMRAMMKGVVVPPHRAIVARLMEMNSYSFQVMELAKTIRQVSLYLGKKQDLIGVARQRVGALTDGEQHMPIQDRNPRTVFVIYGRQMKPVAELSKFVHSLGLEVLDFYKVAADAGPNPFVADVVSRGIASAQTAIVLFTADEYAALDVQLRRTLDRTEEVQRWQSRPNVFFEAGLAFAMNPGTILATLGRVELPSDIQGKHFVRLGNTPQARAYLRDKLLAAGCEINKSSNAWMDSFVSGDFESCVSSPSNARDPFDSPSIAGASKTGQSAAERTGVAPILIMQPPELPDVAERA